jgi:2-hydroxychromene-2-carboxylate isomerase
MGERKKTAYYNDLLAWAEFTDVELSPKARELRKTDAEPPLRAAIVAKEMGGFSAFHHNAYKARWCDGRDMSEPEVLAEVLTLSGLDADAILTRANSDEIQGQLDKATEDAIARGVFGVPTLLVGDRMFWGNDRFELARYYIERARS